MANVSYLRPGASGKRSAQRLHRQLVGDRRRGPKAYTLGALTVVLVIVAAALIAVASSGPGLSGDPQALARVDLPLGGGSIQSILVTQQPTGTPVPVLLHGNRVWPRELIRAGQRLDVYAVIKRPSSISWLTGSTQRVHLALTTPTTRLRRPYLTLPADSPLRVQFTNAVQWFAYGEPGALKRRLLLTPHTSVVLPRTSPAGTELISAAPRIWETAPAAPISWFPAGTQRASAVASPSPGSIVGPDTPITLTFSEPVADALGGHLPPVSPVTTGSWHTISPHTIVFQPEGYGYGLGATVTVPLPGGVQLVGGHQSNSGSVASWSVPPGSTLRLQQLLALLGYLPVTFHPAGLGGIALTPHAQEQAAVHPPGGAFAWRYPNTPGALKSFWQPGAEGTVTRGAVMAFENDQGITPDGIAGAAVWRALIGAAIAGKRSPFGYTFASVSEGSPETLSLWHNGSTILTTPVNTGVAGAPTATGLYPVFEHIASGTMSGTNPDGSHYVDPGIPWISYFNGGDALHGFIRPGYGYPQSDGCVEMPPATAGRVWPYTPIGTLVNVT